MSDWATQVPLDLGLRWGQEEGLSVFYIWFWTHWAESDHWNDLLSKEFTAEMMKEMEVRTFFQHLTEKVFWNHIYFSVDSVYC